MVVTELETPEDYGAGTCLSEGLPDVAQVGVGGVDAFSNGPVLKVVAKVLVTATH
ncbi:hypothetical protein OG596_09665 [Streptomyces sp. NBC_01102]|uniref:hypothetical protein n=1 Tax=Streptomyces sp. NBC_01102 TaxID=2903749 RepID=UPI003866BFDF|nr:hypothetical protein OG596_09665 [Streptomyces sp. NBC_01102]